MVSSPVIIHFFLIFVGTVFGSSDKVISVSEMSSCMTSIHHESQEFNTKLYELLKKGSTIESLLRASDNHKDQLLQQLKRVFENNNELFEDDSEDSKKLSKSTDQIRETLKSQNTLPNFIRELSQYYELINQISIQKTNIVKKDHKVLSEELIEVLKVYTNNVNCWDIKDRSIIVEVNDLCKHTISIIITIVAIVSIILIFGGVGFYFLLRKVNSPKNNSKNEDINDGASKTESAIV